MIDMGLTVLVAAVKKLYDVYKNHKELKREIQEVEEFLKYIREQTPILNGKIGGLNPVKKTLRGKLETASNEVEGWSRRNSNFFRTDERLQKIRGVRQKVKDAVSEAFQQVVVNIYDLEVGNNEMLHELLNRNHPQPAKNAAVPAKHRTPAKPNVQNPKPHPSKLGAQGIAKTSHPRSKSTPGRAVIPRKAPPSSGPRAAIASTPRRDETVELFVRMDSDKQERDVVKKLEDLSDVKKAFSDQTSNKVSVVPHKGVTLNTDQLLKQAQLENKHVLPTLWSKRPW